MSDPVEVAQQAQTIANSAPVNHAGWAILGGIVLKVIEALARLLGTRKERADGHGITVRHETAHADVWGPQGVVWRRGAER